MSLLYHNYTMNNLFFSRYEDSFATSIRQGVTVHSVHSNALRDAQKSCIRMISRRNSRVFCELCSQKTPRGTLPVNSNLYFTLTTYSPFSTSSTSVSPVWTSPERIFLAVSVSTYF